MSANFRTGVENNGKIRVSIVAPKGEPLSRSKYRAYTTPAWPHLTFAELTKTTKKDFFFLSSNQTNRKRIEK